MSVSEPGDVTDVGCPTWLLACLSMPMLPVPVTLVVSTHWLELPVPVLISQPAGEVQTSRFIWKCKQTRRILNTYWHSIQLELYISHKNSLLLH